MSTLPRWRMSLLPPLIRCALLAFLLLGAHGMAAHYVRGPHGFLLPDPAMTPGEVIEGVTAEDVCRPGYAKSVRDVPINRKHLVYQLYGVQPQKDVCCETDHLISLELGGSNAASNLWPQPWDEARQKDKLENFLHRAVCTGAMTLADAQEQIAHDWGAAYTTMTGGQ